MDFDIEDLFSWPDHSMRPTVTSDGHVVAFVEDEGGMRFWRDGYRGPPFEGVAKLRDGRLATYVSPDGAHVAFVGDRSDGPFVGRDDAEDPPLAMFSRSVPPTFDYFGRRLAYGGAITEGEVRLIVDGEPIGDTELAPVCAAFSRQGDRLAYAETRSGKQVEHRIVLDGVRGEWFRGLRNAENALQFSPDGRRFAYYAIDGRGHARWIVDGLAQRDINDVRPIGLAQIRGIGVIDPPLAAGFSPDSRRFAYFADVVEKGVAVIEDDVPGPLVKGVGLPTFSPDSRRLAYAAQRLDDSWCQVVDGDQRGGWSGGSVVTVFSADSRHVAASVTRVQGGFLRKRTQYAAALDGEAFPFAPADDSAMRPTFSSDGSRLAWWIKRGAETILTINGTIDESAPAMLTDVRADPAGRFVYVGRIGTKVSVIVDGQPGPLADDLVTLCPAAEIFGENDPTRDLVPFRSSPDGRHVAWAGLFDGRPRPVVDDEVGPPFDDIVECRFQPDGTAVWWARRGTNISRVRAATSPLVQGEALAS